MKLNKKITKIAQNIIFFVLTFSFVNASAQNNSEQINSNFLYNGKALASFYNAIKTQDTPTHIIYVGDSHTAADFITGSLRASLQAKWGDAGRGIFQSGNPYLGFSARGLEIKTPKEWSNKISFPLAKKDNGQFGFGGYRTTIIGDGIYEIKALENKNFDRISICVSPKSKNDKLDFETPLLKGTIEFNSSIGKINCKKSELSAGVDYLSFKKTPDSSAPEISSIGVWRQSKGIILSSFGIPGAQLKDFAQRDFYALTSEANIILPNMFVIAFGTNEGFEKDFDINNYKEILIAQIAKLRKISPEASILIIGAPDANRKTKDSGSIDDCKILDEELIPKYPEISASDHGAKYYPPPSLKNIREIQKQVAIEKNTAFWDWESAMGGACSANSLSLLPEREIMADRVHFSKIGAQKIGKKIADDLIADYEQGVK